MTTVEAADLVKERGHEQTPLMVVGGTLRRRDSTVVLDAHATGYSPFFGLAAADGEGSQRLLGQGVTVRGCYTSGDVRRPGVRGAVGMFQVEGIEPAVD